MSRRTVKITGHPDRYRRPGRTATQVRQRPDTVAFWAVLLGVFMIFMALASAQVGVA